MDVQTRLFEQIQTKLTSNETLGVILMECLDLSRDSAYRRLRGETSLSPEEIKILCKKFEISFDKILGIEGKAVTFQFNPFQRSDFKMSTYMEGIQFGFTRMTSQKWARLFLSNLDITVFQLLNFPDLMRFKLLFFTQTFIHSAKDTKQKFHIGWKGDVSDELIRDCLQKYTSIPSHEVIGVEAGKGLIREIVMCYEAGLFESAEDATKLLDQVDLLLNHYGHQMEIGKKYIYGLPIPAGEENYKVYLSQTYLQDNTFISETNAYRLLYITHNMMNYLYTYDEEYVNRSYNIFHTMMENCEPLHGSQSKFRNQYFSGVKPIIEKAKNRILGAEIL